MIKFAYNNAKISITGHTSFELNCGYYSYVFFQKHTNPPFLSKSANKLSAELQDLMTVCWKNLHYAQEFQKRAHNENVKPKSYTSGDKVWLNKKYIKTKRNWKLEAKFFGPFQVLHPIGKQAYKLKLPKWWKMHNFFHVSLLEQDTTRKKRVNKRLKELELEAKNSKEYEVETIWDSAVYASKLESSQLPALYYLVAWKKYPKEENTWKLLFAVQHLKKLINSFHKNDPEKPAATSPPINSALPMVRPTVRLTPFK